MDLKLRNRVVHYLLSHIQPQCIHVTPKHELCPTLLHGLSIESAIMPYSSLCPKELGQDRAQYL